jgi:ABC-type uncharacterized transport system permease subunit
MIRMKRSPMAQEIARWATFSYEFALTLIAVGLVVATIFAVLSPERLAQQLLTVVFLGIIPALFTYLIGFMAYWALKGASAIYDPARIALGLTSHVLTNIAVIGLRSLVPALKLLSRWANQLASNFFLACRSAVAPLLNGVGPGSLTRHASKRRSTK